MTIFYSAQAHVGAEGELRVAQQTLNTHATSTTGACATCGDIGPCAAWQRAASAFAKHVQAVLPRRVPGLTRPDRTGARRIA